MKSVLFLVASDPRASGRPAEAVRMAAGLSAWKKVEVSIYLRGAAVLMLHPPAGVLVDEEYFQQYLPIVCEIGRPIFVEQNAALLKGAEETAREEISDARLAELAASHSHVLRF